MMARTVAGARPTAAEWQVWGTSARLVVTDPAALTAARSLIEGHLYAVGLACSRFRDDSEIRALATAGGRPVRISPLLADHLRVALAVARDTGGDVDPTVGNALLALGYDRDFTLVETSAGPIPVAVRSRSDWSQIQLTDTTVTVPPGVLLDLGATAKAHAADRCARLVFHRFGCGVLVSLGGDIATAGPAPEEDWQILVQDGRAEPATRISLPAGAALATSSTLRRRWRRSGHLIHHIIDPRTGAAADPIWRTVSVVAGTCVTANASATAAIVRGRSAPGPLRESGLPTRLVDRAGAVVVLNGWPAEGEGR
ncbi:FAD:protein FMN transferase [Nocardia sp. alder85J]|uniref:FAD:protein FMN transferase n=1 Tax=Nocardia sp. alder85J TaxID=2862949 RepID=UPI001CD61C47|nr:FAD:protein FMN transferase [Nocardia sp. alder85J]MCX4095803.1 FAD:protein FMN transferase [Nocardia sp. alder85J]